MSLLNLHLGDNADVNDGDFANTTYVGLSVALPLRMLNPSKRNQLVIYTSAIETLADWQAHVVTLDFYFLGYLKDKPGSATERHFFDVPAFFIDGAPRRLNIAVIGRGPGLEDDFVLKSIGGVRLRSPARLGVIEPALRGRLFSSEPYDSPRVTLRRGNAGRAPKRD